MKTVALYIVIFVVNTVAVAAQVTGGRILHEPKKYMNSPDGTVLQNSKEGVDSRAFWVVCSDRDDNITYTDGNGKVPFKRVGFLEKFFVTDENENYLHLYKFSDGAVTQEGRLSAMAADCGWAKKSDMLLWLRCLEDNRYISEKAFLTFDSNGGVVNFGPYTQPSLKIKNKLIHSHTALLFVYKTEGNSVLLGRGYQSNPVDIQNDIVGWFDKLGLQFWEGNKGIQLNSYGEAIDERRNTGVKASFFMNSAGASKWKTSGASNEASLLEDSRAIAVQSTIFPLLHDTDGDIVHTGYLAKATSAGKHTSDSYNRQSLLWDDTSGTVVFTDAYTSLKVGAVTQPVYTRGLYLSYIELDELIAALSPSTFPGSLSDARDKIKDAFITIIKTYNGGEAAKKVISEGKISLGDILFLITGFHSTYGLFTSSSISDIAKPKKVSDEDIGRMQRYLISRVNELQAVRSNPQVTRDYPWGSYHWVSEDLLP